MIASADQDPIRPQDVEALLRQAACLPWTRRKQRLVAAVKQGDGVAMAQLARLVEP